MIKSKNKRELWFFFLSTNSAPDCIAVILHAPIIPHQNNALDRGKLPDPPACE